MANKKIKEFAKELNVSYEAIRQSIKRYENELIEHIKIINNTKYLDDYAQEFLIKNRKKAAVQVFELASTDEIEKLKEENASLYKELHSKESYIIMLQKSLLENNEKIALLEKNDSEIKNLQNSLIQKDKEIQELKEKLEFEKSTSFLKKFLNKFL